MLAKDPGYGNTSLLMSRLEEINQSTAQALRTKTFMGLEAI